MRIAIIADIHSNDEALKACYEYIIQNKVNHIIFLGDYFTDYPNPQLTIKVLKEMDTAYPCTFIRGNRDDYIINYFNGKENWINNSQTGALLHNARSLTQDDIIFFSSLPIYKVMTFKNCKPFLVMHGSYEGNSHKIRPDLDDETTNEMHRIINNSKYDLLIGGHCHYQFRYEYKGKRLLNPGSTGISKQRTRKTRMLILDWINNDWKESMVNLDYNYEAVNQRIIDCNYFEQARWWGVACSKNLYTGGDCTYHLLLRAIELAKQDNQELNEDYFEQAAIQLELDKWKEQYGL